MTSKKERKKMGMEMSAFSVPTICPPYVLKLLSNTLLEFTVKLNFCYLHVDKNVKT